ncbi:MAG: SHOCT domain-containing protein [Planctomycetota bacterium]
MADFSALESGSDASGVRRLRQVLIGCGACQKTIRVPHSVFGGTMNCTSCGTLLKVDKFDLSKFKGDLVDMTHLELEPGDPLLDGGPHGSTMGGSSIQLDNSNSATGTGYALNHRSAGGSAAGASANDSQTQMRELRELNELKHSGAISNDEYKRRKSEIYAGKTLAIQAMSRAADGGAGNRPVLKRVEGSFLPKPVIALIVLAVIGGAGYGAWVGFLKPPSSPDTGSGHLAITSPAVETAPETDNASITTPPAGEESAPGEEPGQSSGTEGGEVDTENPEADLPDPSIGVVSALPPRGQTMLRIPPEHELDRDGPVVSNWRVPWPDTEVSEEQAIAQACDVVKRMTGPGQEATIGVALGPAATGLEASAYRNFRVQMQSILTDTSRALDPFGSFRFSESERTMSVAGHDWHRLHMTSDTDRATRSTILTGIQDGYAVAYWFVGDRQLYAGFLETVGTAELTQP